MGVLCPHGCGHQGIVRNDTADGLPCTPTNPVVRRVLACGHTIGGAGYEEYIAKVNTAKQAHFLEVEASKKKLRDDLAVIAQATLDSGKVA